MPLVSTRVVAEALAVSEQTVRQYARDGVIPFIETPGRHRRYDLDAVVEALAARPRTFPAIDDGIRLDSSSTPRSLQMANGWRVSRAGGGQPADAAGELVVEDSGQSSVTFGAQGDALAATLAASIAALVASGPTAARDVLAAVRFAGVRGSASRGAASVLLVTDADRLRRSGLGEVAVTSVRAALVAEIRGRFAAAGTTSLPRVVVADATMVSAAALLEHEPVDLGVADASDG